jgi:hypothetical protein
MHRIVVLYMLVIVSVLLRELLCGVVQAEWIGKCIHINKNYKVVYVCAFVGYWILSENAWWKQYKKKYIELFRI